MVSITYVIRLLCSEGLIIDGSKAEEGKDHSNRKRVRSSPETGSILPVTVRGERVANTAMFIASGHGKKNWNSIREKFCSSKKSSAIYTVAPFTFTH